MLKNNTIHGKQVTSTTTASKAKIANYFDKKKSTFNLAKTEKIFRENS